MALTFEEETELQSMKQRHKIEFEKLRHENAMEEKKLEVELAKVMGGEINSAQAETEDLEISRIYD